MRSLINSEKTLKGRVYIPLVYPDLTTKRVLTTEWIEGVQLWDKKALTSRWLGGRGKGSPGANSPLPWFDVEKARLEMRTQPRRETVKPERQEWKGARGRGGLGLSTKAVMTPFPPRFSNGESSIAILIPETSSSGVFPTGEPSSFSSITACTCTCPPRSGTSTAHSGKPS